VFLNGLPVTTNPNLVKYKEVKVSRSWKEQLLSWTPWRSHKFVQEPYPDPNVYVIAESAFVMHPTTFKTLQEKLNNDLDDGEDIL